VETKMDNQPTPGGIMQIGTGFWASKILLSAVQFELFTILASKGKMSAAEVKSELGFKCSDRHVYDYLDALAGFGFLTREGLLESAVYSNGRDTDVFLDKKKPTYIGGLLEMLNRRLYQFWGSLEEGLRTGKPQNEAKSGVNMFEALYSSPEALREFISAMGGIQMGNFKAFVEKFDFSKYHSLLDVGGAGGFLSIFAAQRHPQLKCTSFDLAAVEPIAKENIAHFNISDKVSTAPGDFFKDDLPKADVVVMGNILHDWDEEKKVILMTKAYEALPKGGAFVAIESVIDNERKKNLFGMIMSLNMLIETGDGFDYTFDDFNIWAKKAGFSKTELIPLMGPSSAAVAYK